MWSPSRWSLTVCLAHGSFDGAIGSRRLKNMATHNTQSYPSWKLDITWLSTKAPSSALMQSTHRTACAGSKKWPFHWQLNIYSPPFIQQKSNWTQPDYLVYMNCVHLSIFSRDKIVCVVSICTFVATVLSEL
ncbi:hypothetical protein COCON_G00044840 [Conger conger]|uniref:Uncharacterized protein n=1 Tax=Conger conger TaxID=82655 RepID=A0A9Q1DUD0_CONCO|nr:hypothetical protein COCON_G00044840 [Conger conger]